MFNFKTINIMTKFLTVQENVQKEKKETVLTHIQNGKGWEITKLKASSFDEVLYLGYCNIDGDIFSCYSDGVIDIFKGIKGDEFNQ